MRFESSYVYGVLGNGVQLMGHKARRRAWRTSPSLHSIRFSSQTFSWRICVVQRVRGRGLLQDAFFSLRRIRHTTLHYPIDHDLNRGFMLDRTEEIQAKKAPESSFSLRDDPGSAQNCGAATSPKSTLWECALSGTEVSSHITVLIWYVITPYSTVRTKLSSSSCGEERLIIASLFYGYKIIVRNWTAC